MSLIEQLFSLQGRVALVTGGYRGLGGTMASALAEAGATVFLNGRSEDKVMYCVEKFRNDELDAHPAVFDVTDENAVQSGVASIIKDHGKIDILINNAGINKRNLLKDMPLQDWRDVIDTNLTAAFIVGKAVAASMRKNRRGKIINVCSLTSELARSSTGNYAAAKGGLKMLTRAMTAEWAKRNIQVNGICPGYFETELTQVLKDNPEFDLWISKRIPSGRWGKPQDLKGLVIYLASPASDYVNGQLFFADGGLTAVV